MDEALTSLQNVSDLDTVLLVDNAGKSCVCRVVHPQTLAFGKCCILKSIWIQSGVSILVDGELNHALAKIGWADEGARRGWKLRVESNLCIPFHLVDWKPLVAEPPRW